MKRIIVFLALCLATAALHAQEETGGNAAEYRSGGLDIRGSVLDSTLLLHDAEAGTVRYAGFIRASLAVRNRDRENAKFDLDASLGLLYGQYADAFLAAMPAFNAPIELEIRKLSLSLYLGPVDLTLGRRIVNWGYGRVFSPADAYSTVDLSDISLRRIGSDILMAELSFGEASGAAAILSPTTDMTGFKAGGRLFTNLLDFDASLIGVYADENADLTVGAALKGTMPFVDVGLTLEGVRHVLNWGGDGWFEAMAGLDYSFFDRKLILLAEYYFNERPINPAALTPAELAAVDRPFFGRHYVFGSAQIGFTDTFMLSASLLANAETLAAIGAFQLSAAIFDAVIVSGSVRLLSGDVNSLPGAEGLRLNYGVSCEVKF
jgi:hypothetical protein